MCLQISTKRFRFFFRYLSTLPEIISILDTSNSSRSSKRSSILLDYKIPKSNLVVKDDRHQRLLQSCMEDLLVIEQEDKKIEKLRFAEAGFLWKDPLSLFLEIHRSGVCVDENVVSSSLSSCGELRYLLVGEQLYGLSIKLGFSNSVIVGSSMISLYSKCERPESAHQVFDEMPAHNTISWTAWISAHARNSDLETSISLFVSMRRSSISPNGFTFACVLSSCTNTAALAQGRSVHCSAIAAGFDSHLHVSNSLISMYSKCGSIKESCSIFEKMEHKDLVSWNSMMFGFARYGLAAEAIALLEEMIGRGVGPDSKSFLGVLSACRHAGLLAEARRCFFSMLCDHGVKPELDHYSCLIDLLGRSGRVEEALKVIESMPMATNAVIWGSLLSACRLHGNSSVGVVAAERRISLKPECAATYVQLANLYASAGRWDSLAGVRKAMKEKGLRTSPGFSWVEVGSSVFRFRAEDCSSTQGKEALLVLDCLAQQCREEGSEKNNINCNFYIYVFSL